MLRNFFGLHQSGQREVQLLVLSSVSPQRKQVQNVFAFTLCCHCDKLGHDLFSSLFLTCSVLPVVSERGKFLAGGAAERKLNVGIWHDRS